jgi:hypothetical protein
MYELEDIWLKAFHAFPDVKPLVALLRSDTPMPSGPRKLLAELLCPGDPPIDSYILELKSNPKFHDLINKKLDTAYNFAQAKEAGQSEADAASSAGKVERQIYRYLADLKKLGQRLRGEQP